MSNRTYTLDFSELTTERLEVLRDSLTGEVADEFNVLTAMVNDELFDRHLDDNRAGFQLLRTCTQGLLEAGYASVHNRTEREQLTSGMRELLCMLGFDNADMDRAMARLLVNEQPHAIHTVCAKCGLDIEGWTDDGEDWRDRGNNTHCDDGGRHRPSDG